MIKSKDRKSRRGRVGHGVLVVLTTLLVSSAGMRVAIGAGAALAEGNGKSLGTQLQAPSDGPAARQTDTPNDVSDRGEISNLLKALKERETRVEEQEKQLEMRSKSLAVADAEVEQRLADLKAAEEALRKTLALADGAAESDLANLTSVYENMKPKDAARLFETMEPAFAAGFLGRMQPEAAASVLAGLSPEAAYSISVILAGRNANAPKS